MDMFAGISVIAEYQRLPFGYFVVVVNDCASDLRLKGRTLLAVIFYLKLYHIRIPVHCWKSSASKFGS